MSKIPPWPGKAQKIECEPQAFTGKPVKTDDGPRARRFLRGPQPLYSIMSRAVAAPTRPTAAPVERGRGAQGLLAHHAIGRVEDRYEARDIHAAGDG